MGARYQQWVINLTLGGRSTWRHAGRDYEERSGDLLILRPAAVVEFSVPALSDATPNDGYWEVVWTMFHPSPRCEEWLCAQPFTGDISHIALRDPALLTRMRRGMMMMHRLYTSRMLHRDEWTELALERLVLTLHTHTAERATEIDEDVLKAMNFIQERYASPLTVAGIARAAHLSLSHFSALFTRQVGIPPAQYLERVRMQRAADLLYFTRNPINEIASATGYADANYFGRRFRRYCGQSPRAFRESKNQLSARSEDY